MVGMCIHACRATGIRNKRTHRPRKDRSALNSGTSGCVRMYFECMYMYVRYGYTCMQRKRCAQSARMRNHIDRVKIDLCSILAHLDGYVCVKVHVYVCLMCIYMHVEHVVYAISVPINRVEINLR